MMPLELTHDQRARLDRLRARFGADYVVRLRNAADAAARREFDRVIDVNLHRGEIEAELIRPMHTADTIPPTRDTLRAPPPPPPLPPPAGLIADTEHYWRNQ